MRGLLLLVLLWLATAPAAAQQSGQEARLREIAERGRLLFEVDRAAWVTTDDLMQRAPEAKGWPVKGWVVERDGDSPHSYVVTYYGDGKTGPTAWYVGKVRDNKVTSGEVFPLDKQPPLTAAQQNIVRARAAALAEAEKRKFRPCTAARFNVAVLPSAASDGPFDVYLLSAQTRAGTYPFGGHYVVRVGSDGKVMSKRKFTNSCLNMSTDDVPSGGTPAALMVTHLLDPIPTEIHAFLSIWMDMPIGVGTQRRLYWVEKGEITTISGGR